MAECTVKFNGVEVTIKDDQLSGDECLQKTMAAALDLHAKTTGSPEIPGVCWYRGQQYSDGSRQDMSGGVKTCENGAWK